MASINSRRLRGRSTIENHVSLFILQRKATIQDKSVYTRVDKTHPSRPNPGIFSRAVKKAIGGETSGSRSIMMNPKSNMMDSDVDEEQFSMRLRTWWLW
ncbi:hypothetical protein EVAR_92011_1 [Eumeta japonica]|uniref:Uncharacterized protein n=1 Tax=Eumeta variegata TaxID=151549 RepID=A0A4C1ZXH7_EUMVA|nr:hypothetical protein EVAR_92011_1 [Eumeta japonica]